MLEEQLDRMEDSENDNILEEEEVTEVLAAWLDARKKIQASKTSRGFSRKPNIDALRAKVRCFRYKQKGHFKRDCKATPAPVEQGRKEAAAHRAKGTKNFPVDLCTMIEEDLNELEHGSLYGEHHLILLATAQELNDDPNESEAEDTDSDGAPPLQLDDEEGPTEPATNLRPPESTEAEDAS